MLCYHTWWVRLADEPWGYVGLGILHLTQSPRPSFNWYICLQTKYHTNTKQTGTDTWLKIQNSPNPKLALCLYNFNSNKFKWLIDLKLTDNKPHKLL